MHSSILGALVLGIVSNIAPADEPKGRDEQRELGIRVSLSSNENIALSFEKAKVLQEGLTGLKIVMDGKALPLALPNGLAVEDFKLVDVGGAKNGPAKAKLELRFKPTRARLNTFVLIPVYEKGKEGKPIAKLNIQVIE